ncbi:MAG: motB [Actinomycetia bacterium]|nr:motB [Actinomycetes bacterium]
MASRRKKHEEHEEHVNHERWLITYADMITLLMVLFIVLFSMSQVDLAKYQKLKQSLSGAFGSNPIQGGAGVLSSGTSPIPMPGIAIQAQKALAAQQAQAQAVAAETAALEQTKKELGAALDKVGLGGGVGLHIERRGLVVTIASDKVLFVAGQATLQPEGRQLIHQLAAPLAALPNPLRIEGHTDDVPIDGTFASNWELSTARATTVLRELESAHAVSPARLSATGFADQRPIASNSTAAGRARNRRVEILVEATTQNGGGS